MGLRRWFCAAVAAALLASPAPSGAVVADGLILDTPRTREALKQETGASVIPSKAGVPEAVDRVRGDFESIWFAREKYLQIGENEKAQQQLQTLWESALNRGVRNLPEYGAVLVREAERRISSRDWEQAATALGWARRLSPDELSVYATGALLALRRNPFNPVPAFAELAAGWRAVGRSFRLQSWLWANLLGTLLSSLAFFFVVGIGISAVAVALRLVHDIRESLRFGSLKGRSALAWAVLAAPVLLGFSPWWWVVCAGLMLWPYFAMPARGLTAAGGIFLLLLPSMIREQALLLTSSERPLLAAVAQVREGNWGAADRATLAAEAERGNAGVPGMIALGVASRRLGILDPAEAAFRSGLQAAPNDPVLWLNLGNIAFARQDVQGAVAAYTKSAELDPRAFAPHFNLGSLFRETYKFDESGNEMKRVAELDPAAAEFYGGLDLAHLKGFTLDGLPRTRDLWTIARKHDDQQAEAVADLWDSLMLGPSFGSWTAVTFVLLLLGAGLGIWRIKRGTASQCTRCGRLFCAHCQPGRSGELCSQCHHIFVKKEGVDAGARVRKMAEIKVRRRRLRVRHLACAALVPGGGHFSAGRFGAGVLFLLPASFLEARAVLGLGGYPSPWSLGSAAGSWFAGVGIAAFAVLWLLSLWLTFRFED